MANWATLKAAIAGVIKTNGNQEITGQLLQNVLNSIVSSVGENATFVGIATPATNPGAPDGPVFYIASQAGTYSNFGGIKVAEGEAVILEWRGSWTKKTTGLASSSYLTDEVARLDKADTDIKSELKVNADAIKSNADAIKSNGDAIKSNADAIKSNGDAVRVLSERVERSVRLSELGSYFTSGEFMDCVRSGDVSVYGRWKVTDVFAGIDVVVGVVDVFVDSMLHCLTQRLLTNMVVSDSGELDGSHNHSLHEYYRLYNLSWTEEKLPDRSPWPLNSWSAWKDDLSEVLSLIGELSSNLPTMIRLTRGSSDVTLALANGEEDLGSDTIIEAATPTQAGVMSAQDKIDINNLKDKLSVMSAADHVVRFGGFCSGDVLPNSSTHSGSDEGVSVMWNVTCSRFVLYVEGLGVSSGSQQYANWSDASRYGSEQSDSGWLPFTDRLYIDESSNTLYYFRDGDCVKLGIK